MNLNFWKKQKYKAISNGSKIHMHGIRKYACVIYNAILNSLYAVPKKDLLYIWLHKICWQYSISPNFLHSVITFLFLVKIEDSYLVFVQFSLFKILYWHYSFRRVTGNDLECNVPYLPHAIFLVSDMSILVK